MNKETTITLVEEDVDAAIKNYIEAKLGPNESVKDIIYFTGVRGDYDKGTAVEYIKEVIVDVGVKNNFTIEKVGPILEFIELQSNSIDAIEEFVKDFFYRSKRVFGNTNHTVFTTGSLLEIKKSIFDRHSLVCLPEFIIEDCFNTKMVEINGKLISDWIRLNVDPVGQILIVENL